MGAGLSVELRVTTAGRPAAESAMHAAAVRIIARTRVAWATWEPDVSARLFARQMLELKTSRALDNQPRTGD